VENETDYNEGYFSIFPLFIKRMELRIFHILQWIFVQIRRAFLPANFQIKKSHFFTVQIRIKEEKNINQ
jgi:uncharacterized membrane-anchored protein